MFDLLALGLAAAAASLRSCGETAAREIPYVVCRFNPAADDIRLFHADGDGEPFGHFGALARSLQERGLSLVFAMNAGMYHPNRAPVGLYVENGVTRAAVNNRDCSGNFCLKPNGVFWIGEDGAHVAETGASIAGVQSPRDLPPLYATQSGPMLVIDGAIHPKFLADSDSRHRRNGVGVTAEGEVVFAISDAPVTLHEFATLFRDHLNTPNALYLDGAVSRLYAPEIGRNEPGPAMGPIVGVVHRKDPQ